MATVPMGNDIPSNSHKSKAQAQQTQAEKPPIPQFEGESAGVKRKKKSDFARWMRKMFLSDRTPRDILREVVEYRIVPGIKDNMRNSMMSTIDMFLYPGSGPAGPSTSQNQVNYNKMYSGGGTTIVTTTPASSSSTKSEEINKGFSNPCFKTQADATRFLEMMKSYDYPTLSVHTMYMMQKKHIDYTWDAYGWTREEIAALPMSAIRHISNPDWPWMIDLPEAHVVA